MALSPSDIVTIIGSGGLGAFLLSLYKNLQDSRSGKHQREREINADALAQRDRAVREQQEADEARKDAERRRRQVAEYASFLRQILVERHGWKPEHLPPWPSEKNHRSDPD